MKSVNKNLRAPARVDGADLRERNLAVVVHDLLFSQPTSRTEIAERTGLAKASLTQLIPELESLGLAMETTTSKPTSGRPSKLLVFDGSGVSVIVCEVNELEIITETTDLTGRVLRVDREQHFVPMGDPESIVFAMASTISQHLVTIDAAGSRAIHLVVVIDALLRGDKPVVMQASEFGWKEPVDLVGLLEKKLKPLVGSISLVSQVHVAAKAEFDALRHTSDSLPKSVVFLKADSGIGSAVVQNGKLLVGAQGMSPILGHIELNPNGELCECGRRGCFQVEVGPRRILQLAGLENEISRRGIKGAIQIFIEKTRKADPLALATCDILSAELASFSESLSLLYDPDYIVLGGYWAEIFENLSLTATPESNSEDDVYRFEKFAGLTDKVIFRPATYGSRATRVGALQEVLIRVINKPLSIKGTGQVPAMGPIASSPNYIW